MIQQVKSNNFNWNAKDIKESEELAKAYVANRKKTNNPIKGISEKDAIELLKDFVLWRRGVKIEPNRGIGVSTYDEAMAKIADSFREITDRK